MNFKRLLSVYQEAIRAGRGEAGYKEDLREMLYVQEGTCGKLLEGAGSDKNKTRLQAGEFFPLHKLFEAFVGIDTADQLRNKGVHILMEAGAIDPSAYIGINAFTATVQGLLERMFLDDYTTAELIGDQVCTVQPNVVTSGGKKIGISGISDAAVKKVLPGMEYEVVGNQAMYIKVPENEKFGFGVRIEWEAVLYDLTGDIMTKIQDAIISIKRHREKMILRCVLGLTNNYQMVINDVDQGANNTYQTSAGTGAYTYINAKAANPLTDWTSIQASQILLNEMLDPVTKQEIQCQANTILVMKNNYINAQNILNANQRVYLTQSDTQRAYGPNNMPSGPYSVLQSQIARNLLVSEGGLTAQQADATWFMLDPKKGVIMRSVLEPQVTPVALNSAEMVRRDLVGEWTFRYMGQAFVNEPRVMIQNQHS